MEKSVEGMSAASLKLDTPVISGNVSLYNESNGQAIFPTPIVGMVGLHASLKDITPSFFQQEGDVIYLIGETKAEFGGSELQNLLEGKYFGKAPSIDLDVEAKRQAQLLTAIQQGHVSSAHDLAEGGLAVAVAESLFTNKKLGASITVSGDLTAALYSETQSRFLVSVKKEEAEAFEKVVEDAVRIGEVTNDTLLQVKHGKEVVIEEKVDALQALWKGAIPCLLKSKA